MSEIFLFFFINCWICNLLYFLAKPFCVAFVKCFFPLYCGYFSSSVPFLASFWFWVSEWVEFGLKFESLRSMAQWSDKRFKSSSERYWIVVKGRCQMMALSTLYLILWYFVLNTVPFISFILSPNFVSLILYFLNPHS